MYLFRVEYGKGYTYRNIVANSIDKALEISRTLVCADCEVTCITEITYIDYFYLEEKNKQN